MAQVANGDFENWNKLVMFEHPNAGIPTMSSNYETFFADGSLNVTDVVANESRALRIENTMVEGQVAPGYFLFGEVPQNEGESLVFGGGFEVSDPNVNGIRMDLKYNFPDNAHGFIIVQFKAEGQPVGNGNFGTGTFYFPIQGTQDWSNTLFNFDQELGALPDQCVIGIAAADLIGDDIPFTAGAFVEVDNISLENSAEAVPGGNFDSWTFVEPIFYPADCNVDIHPFESQYERSTLAHGGVYALRLNSTEREGQVQIGVATLGQVENDVIVPTIELTENHSSVGFWYHYNAINDLAGVEVRFFAEDQGEFVQVYQKSLILEPNTTYEYVQYAYAEDYSEFTMEPTHMSITFFSSLEAATDPQDGSFLLIDDVEIFGLLSHTPSFNKFNNNIIAYPNPTVGRVQFNFGTNRAGYYRVFNAQGQQVAIRTFSSTRILTHDLSNMPAGKYFFRFYHNAGVESVSALKL
jgi:hypothetical protein